MDGWMEGRIDGYIDWVDGWMDGQTDGQMYVKMNRQARLQLASDHCIHLVFTK